MTYQGNENLSLFAKVMGEQSDSDSEDDYEKCDHEYTIKSLGFRTCLTCGEEVGERTVYVPDEGYENRTIVQRRVNQMTESLYDEIRSTLRNFIHKLSHHQITIGNSLERLFETCKKYILPDDTLVEDGKRSHPFRILARPVSLCASLLWMRVRDLGIAMSMVKFPEKVGVPRSTIIGVNKQLDSGDISKVR